MPEMQSLIDRVQQLSGSTVWWSKTSQVLIGATAIVTLLYFLVSSNALKYAGDLRKAQEILDKAKDDQLAHDLKDKDEEITRIKAKAANDKQESDKKISETNKEAKRIETEANKRIADAKAVAAQANVRAGNLEKENLEMRSGVANLEKEAADAKRAFLELQERLKPRRLAGEQREKIARVLLANPPGKIVVLSMTGSDESYRYASDFDEVFRQCGWTSRVQDITEMGMAPSVGVFLEMADPSATPTYTNTLNRALMDADIKVQPLSTKMVIDEPINLKIGYKP